MGNARSAPTSQLSCPVRGSGHIFLFRSNIRPTSLTLGLLKKGTCIFISTMKAYVKIMIVTPVADPDHLEKLFYIACILDHILTRQFCKKDIRHPLIFLGVLTLLDDQQLIHVICLGRHLMGALSLSLLRPHEKHLF